MSIVKTTKGRTVDMTALAKNHEETVAISPGSSKMNARGDIVDSGGRVLVTVQDRSRLQQRHNEPEEIAGVGGGAPSSEILENQERRAKDQKRDGPEAKPAKETPKAKKPARKAAESAGDSAEVVRREIKTRDDGSVYTEIEYADGSIETKEGES